MSAPYLGFASEDDYHANYSVRALLDREQRPAERRAIRKQLRDIEQRRSA